MDFVIYYGTHHFYFTSLERSGDKIICYSGCTFITSFDLKEERLKFHKILGSSKYYDLVSL